MDPEIPYLLFTPGPLSTTRTVKEAMLVDLPSRDADYRDVVQRVRTRLVELAVADAGKRDRWTAVLMQGSGTFAVEATIGSVVPSDGALLTIRNGAYGDRIGKIADRLGIRRVDLDFGETGAVDTARVAATLAAHPEVTHAALVHCETTTGRINPIAAAGTVCQQHGTDLIVDAMSSFGGIPIEAEEVGAAYLISSANKCIQGVPGFGFVIAERSRLEESAGRARSLSLDLTEQWRTMEAGEGAFRFTSPTHVVLAFDRALHELDEEGGVAGRHARYQENQRVLVAGMEELGFRPLFEPEDRSPIITSFHLPSDPAFSFTAFYEELKRRGFVIYPGKVTSAETFRVGTIGDVHPADFEELVRAVRESLTALGVAHPSGSRHESNHPG